MRRILVHADKKFIITVPDDAELTFGPWSPPNVKEGRSWGEEGKRGTLRVYTNKKADILAVFSGVTSFRDMSIEFTEEVAVEKGDTIWHSDEHGYHKTSSSDGYRKWVTPQLPPTKADPDIPF